jgi:hypothetical protein
MTGWCAGFAAAVARAAATTLGIDIGIEGVA